MERFFYVISIQSKKRNELRTFPKGFSVFPALPNLPEKKVRAWASGVPQIWSRKHALLVENCSQSNKNLSRPLSRFDTHPGWPPVAQSLRSRQSQGKIGDCEQSSVSVTVMMSSIYIYFFILKFKYMKFMICSSFQSKVWLLYFPEWQGSSYH